MSVTSGDPRRLAGFVEAASALTEALAASVDDAVGTYARALKAATRDVPALGSISALVGWVHELRVNEQFAGLIAEALANADGWAGAGVSRLDDGAVKGLMVASGDLGPTGYLSVGDSALLGAAPLSGFCDDPVCTATGNFYHHEADLGFPGRSGVLDVIRSYNSLAGRRVGAFGPGWSCLLDVRLSVVGASEVRVVLADGAEIGFRPDAEGTWRPETRPGLRLARGAAGTWVLLDGPCSSFTFDAGGLLLGRARGRAEVVVERLRGQVVRLLERASGRWVSFAWAGGVVIEAVSSDGRTVGYGYEDGNLASVDRPAGAVRYRLGGGRVESVVDADGVVAVTNTYDDRGRVLTQAGPSGRLSSYTYAEHGVTIVADAQGLARNAFVHDRRGNLASMVDAGGRAMRMRYDPAGRLSGWTDRRGGAWGVTWDESGTRPVRRSGPLGFAEAFSWDGSGRLVAHRGPWGTTRWAYDGDHATPSRIIDAGGAETLIGVSDDDLAASITDADGVSAAFAYDPDGQATTLTDALGNVTRLAYDPAGHLTSLRMPSSITASFEVDAAGRVRRAATPKASAHYEWSAAGRAVGGRDPAEGRWQASFSGSGAIASATNAAGGRTLFSYDASGNPVEITGADGRRYRQHFDGACRLTAVADPSGATWTYEHDPEGVLTGIVEPTGAARRRRLDLLGRQVEETDAAGRTWQRRYGADGRLAEIIDPSGEVTSYRYDAAGRPSSVAVDGRILTELTWSPAGRLLSRREVTGTTRYRYDPAGRLAGVGDDWGSVSLVLSVDGRVVRSVDERGRVIDVRRDEAGRAVAVTDRQGVVRSVDLDAAGRPLRAASGPSASTFSWDQRGLLAAAADPLGATTAQRYDMAGRLTATTDPLGGRTSYAYDQAGRLASVVDPLGATTELLRDVSGAVMGAVGSGGGGWRVWRDPSGLVTGYSPPGAAQPSVHVRRDAAGRLVGAGRPWELSAGRRRPERPLPAVDEAGRIAAGPAGELYRHDAAGQLVEWVSPEDVSMMFTYDTGGRLVAERCGGARTSYDHDALGRLLRRIGPDATVTDYRYDASGRRVEEVSASGTVTYRWDAAGRLAGIRRGDEVTGIVLDNLGLPVSIGGTEVSWDLTSGSPEVARIGDVRYERVGGDLLAVAADGSRRQVAVDWAGNAEEALDPWGASAGTGVRLGYRGELCIDGLVWLGARPYDPATRSFLAPDPLPNPAGAPCAANPYHYAWNDPVTFVDPTGLRPLTDAEFEVRRHSDGLGALGRVWESVSKDPWGDLVLGLTVAAGVGLMFVPGGQLVGGAILIGVGSTTAMGLATGNFSPRGAALNGVLGGVTAGAGSALSEAAPVTQFLVRAGMDAGTNLANQAASGGHVDLRSLVIGLGISGAGTAISAKLSLAEEANAANEAQVVHSRYSDGTPVYEGEQPPKIRVPDPLADGTPHTALKWDEVNGRVYKAREYGSGGIPIRDVDFTHPTYPSGILRPDHSVPEQHLWVVNDEDNPRAGYRREDGRPI